jgi:hypothetical protein
MHLELCNVSLLRKSEVFRGEQGKRDRLGDELGNGSNGAQKRQKTTSEDVKALYSDGTSLDAAKVWHHLCTQPQLCNPSFPIPA